MLPPADKGVALSSPPMKTQNVKNIPRFCLDPATFNVQMTFFWVHVQIFSSHVK